MKIRATRVTAFLVGSVMAALMMLNESGDLPRIPQGSMNTIFKLFVTVAFFVTMTLLVVGLDHIRFRRADVLRNDYMKGFRQGASRMVFWFLGAATTGLALHYVLTK